MNNLYDFDLGDRKLDTMEARVLPWKYAKGDATLRLNYALNSHSLVYDVGGYKGEWATEISELYACKIDIFEPVKSFYTKLDSMFKDNNHIVVYPYGLAGENRTEKIGVDWEASSIFKPGEKTEKIKLVDIAKTIDTKTVDLMKINIEGGEYELLNKLCDTAQISQVVNIQVQFHDFVPNAIGRRRSLQKRLENTHHLTYCYPFIWENWERNT